jgi:hypothetical protein
MRFGTQSNCAGPFKSRHRSHCDVDHQSRNRDQQSGQPERLLTNGHCWHGITRQDEKYDFTRRHGGLQPFGLLPDPHPNGL